MADRSLPDLKDSERNENCHIENVGEIDPETGDYAKENGINIICHRRTESTTQLYGVKNYESLGKS